jgi:dTDP-4-amino-4,6-dideoxygalactose transaminase
MVKPAQEAERVNRPRSAPSDPVRPRERFLVFGKPTIEAAEIREVVASMDAGWLGTGPKVQRFERDFAAYQGVSGAVAVSSCTAALHLSLLAAGLGPGDEVITTPMTFCASVNAILHAGATPVLADVLPNGCIDPAAVAAAITPRTRALLPVHYAGRPCDMDALGALAERHGLLVIEDCAHALETEWRGRKAGQFGDFGCFSFYATKNITTGEGGMVIAKSEENLARIKVLALHGMSKDAWKRFSDEGYKHYQCVELGFKYNMMDLQAAIGLHQLPRIERWWQRREELWRRYEGELADLPLGRPPTPEPGTRHAYHLYTLLVDERQCGLARDRFLEALTAEGIGVGVHYLAIPEHPYYQQRFGWRPEHTPVATGIGRRTLSLPLSPGLTDDDARDVITAVRKVVGA